MGISWGQHLCHVAVWGCLGTGSPRLSAFSRATERSTAALIWRDAPACMHYMCYMHHMYHMHVCMHACTYVMSSSNKIVSLIKLRSFLGLLLNAVIRRLLGFIIDEPKRPKQINFWTSASRLQFWFWIARFCLCVAYVKSEQFGQKCDPQRGGGTSGVRSVRKTLFQGPASAAPGTRNKKSFFWG